MTRRRRVSKIILGALAAFVLASSVSAEERTLLTADGTLYHVQSGFYRDLEPQGTSAQPGDFVLRWDSRDQSGAVQSGLIPGTNNRDPKDQMDLAYDSVSQSLVLVWNDRLQVLNSIAFAIFQKGIWTQSQLLPSGVFSFASNPRILITHQQTMDSDAEGNDVVANRSIISMIWWEDSFKPRARFAPIFVEGGSFNLSDIQIYDLPELVGSQSIEQTAILENPLFATPTIQQEGLSSSVLATFGDVATQSIHVVRIGFPSDFRHVIDPMHGRHVPVILGHSGSPLLLAVPPTPIRLGTIVGSSYFPTVYWQSDPDHVNFSVSNGTSWTDTRSLALGGPITADAAIDLIRRMAIQN